MRVLPAVLTAAALAAAPQAAAGRHQHGPPPLRVAQALCVHAGVRYAPRRQWRGQGPSYVLWGHGYFRLHRYDDVTSGTGPNGEGAWDAHSDPRYGGGMSFTLATWRGAGGAARTTLDIARASPAEQIRRALIVVARDGGWLEWPNTSASCGF